MVQGHPQGPGPCILAIDTATPLVGAALLDPQGQVHSWSLRATRGADALLLPALEQLLRFGRPSLITVSIGPGAFTGLRVGVSAALGLALSLGAKVLPLSSLAARAAIGAGSPRVLVLLDGKKERAYASFWEQGRPGAELDIPPEAAVVLPGEGPFIAVGEGALVWRGLVEAAGGTVHERAEANPAVEMLTLAQAAAAEAIAPEQVQLHYIRPSDAQLPQEPAPR